MIKKLILKSLNSLGYELIKSSRYNKKIHDKLVRLGKPLIKKISTNLEILNGPFKGMKYPSLEISEVTLVPKIIGSYEDV